MKVRITFEVDDETRKNLSLQYGLLWMARREDIEKILKEEVQTFLESIDPERLAEKDKDAQ